MKEADLNADLVIRSATQTDVARLIELLEGGALVAGREDLGDFESYRSALAEIVAGPGTVLVAERNGVVVAMCQLVIFRHFQARGSRCAEVESVHVHPDVRGQGIGHALMEAVIEQARQLGCARLQLTSNVARPRAHSFYESLGFSPSHIGFKLALK